MVETNTQKQLNDALGELKDLTSERDDLATILSDSAPGTGIVRAMAAISAALASTGIAKGKKAEGYGAGFKFRGIDDVQQALAPLLAANVVTMTPEVEAVDQDHRQTKSGSVMYHATVRVRYVLRHVDGSSYSGVVPGEACDNGDKAIGKAMSYAYKTFALQAFCIPTESTEDPDATVHEPSEPMDPNVLPFLDGGEALAAIDYAMTTDALDLIVRRLKASTAIGDDEKPEIKDQLRQRGKQLSQVS